MIGMIVLAASFSLFAHIEAVKDSDMPMLAVVNDIHPALAFVYALTIFALIFNTAFSLYYCHSKKVFRRKQKENESDDDLRNGCRISLQFRRIQKADQFHVSGSWLHGNGAAIDKRN